MEASTRRCNEVRQKAHSKQPYNTNQVHCEHISDMFKLAFLHPFPFQRKRSSSLPRNEHKRPRLGRLDKCGVFCIGPNALPSPNATAATSQRGSSARSKPHPKLPAFSKIVSGEWFGYEAAFSSCTGRPLTIEDRFVPDAFREWGVEVMGFDTVTSTRVTSDIYQKRTRALPSVGCEADAVVPDIRTRTYENFFAFADGSFCNGPYNLEDACEWGFTLTDPSNATWRARIEFGLDSKSKRTNSLEYIDTKIIVFIERREADFCDGQFLPGCAGIGGFAAETPMNPYDLNGTWDVRRESFDASHAWHLTEGSMVCTRLDAQQEVSVALPRGLSVGIRRCRTSVHVAVGWLRENVRVVLRRTYNQEGILSSVSRDLETRQM